MNNITEIEISKLLHHPQNPRKNLGDLTELADSIKASGIMQNLTVVKEDDHYLVVIGNRRMEAAKKAGLKTVPCAVVEMTAPEQLSTMMVENMQRSDLTIFEQAQGFQLMMDMGDTVDSIAEKTGFSTSTVRRRVKLMELDQKELKKVSKNRQISMSDFDELNKISDIDTRNRVLTCLGTNGFRYELNRALETETAKRNLAAAVKLMEEKKIPRYQKNGTLIFAGALGIKTDDPQKIEKAFLERFGGFDGFYYECTGNVSYMAQIALYRKRTESEDQEAEKEALERKRTEFRMEVIKRVNHDMWLSRLTFIRNYKESSAREHLADIARTISERAASSDYRSLSRADLRLIMQIHDDADDDTVNARIRMAADSSPMRLMLWTAYDLLDDYYDERGYLGGSFDGSPWYNTADKAQLDRIYDFLEKLGYEPGEEEQDTREGLSRYFNADDEVYKLEEDKKQVTIDDMDLDVRTYNALKRAGITSADELMEAVEDGSLFKVVRVKYKQLVEKAAKCGITLPESPSGTDEE